MLKTEWDYSNGLSPLKKKKLTEKNLVTLENYEAVYETNVDGIPYVLIDRVADELAVKKKYKFIGNDGLYTLQNIDLNNKFLTFKLDKTLNLNDRLLQEVQDYYDGWGIKRTAKCNYIFYGWGTQFDVEGKLSINQTVQVLRGFIKINEINKNENGINVFKGEHVERDLLLPVYPYKENNKLVDWYFDIEDVWLRQAVEYKKKKKMKEELNELNDSFLQFYGTYKNTRLHSLYEWATGLLGWNDMINEISTNLLHDKEDIVEFVEELYDIQLKPFQKALLIKTFNNKGSLYRAKKHQDNQMLMDGIKKYKEKYKMD